MDLLLYIVISLLLYYHCTFIFTYIYFNKIVYFNFSGMSFSGLHVLFSVNSVLKRKKKRKKKDKKIMLKQIQADHKNHENHENNQ